MGNTIFYDEKNFESYICENVPSIFGDDCIYLSRQFRITDHDIADMLLYDCSDGKLCIVEIKNVTAGDTAITQIMRYMSLLRDYISEEEISKFDISGVKGVIIAPDISDSAKILLRWLYSDVSFICLDFIPHSEHLILLSIPEKKYKSYVKNLSNYLENNLIPIEDMEKFSPDNKKDKNV